MGICLQSKTAVASPESPCTVVNQPLLSDEFPSNRAIPCDITLTLNSVATLGTGGPVHQDLYYVSHLSPVNGLFQQGDHVLALTARCLEALCPLEEDALEK